MATQLRFETTADDYRAKLARYAAASGVSRGFLRFAYFAIVGLAWLSAGLFYVKQGDRSAAYLFYAAFALALTLGLPAMYRLYQQSFWASVLTAEALRGLVGQVVLTIGDEGVEAAGPVLTARAAWRDLLRIERDGERTMIFLAPLIAVVVPRRAFADDAAREAFEREIGRCIEDAQRESVRGDASPPAS